MIKHDIYDEFLKIFPPGRLDVLTLEEYTNLDKTSFCYWLESKTQDLGSIWGGSSYKFGVYKRNPNTEDDKRNGYSTDGEYAWVTKYGNSRNEAFLTVRSIIKKIQQAVVYGDLKAIDNIDFGFACKWKIAFLYSNKTLINTFKDDNLRIAAQHLGMDLNPKTPASEIQTFLIEKRNNKDIFEYGHYIWQLSIENKFKQYWLFAPGERAYMWEDFYKDGIMAIGWDLDNLNSYSSKKEIAEALINLYDSNTNQRNNAACNYDSCNSIQEGDVIIAKEGFNTFLGYGIVLSDYYFDETVSDYRHRRKVEWKKKGRWDGVTANIQKTLSNITNKLYCDDLKQLIGIDESIIVNRNNNMNKPNISLNVILCGPPGTGKTYRIQHEYTSLFTDENYSLTKDEFIKNQIKDMDWWSVIAMTLYTLGAAKVGEINDHKFIRIKDSQSENKTPRNTIWNRLQRHALEDSTNIANRTEPYICRKDENSIWSIDKGLMEESMPDVIEILNNIDSYKEKKTENKRYQFITFHQKYSYEDFIIGITPALKSEDSEINEGSASNLQFEKKYGIFHNCCIEALKLAGYNNFDECYSDTKENRKQKFQDAPSYALFIDEINRANISAVFGELITCIEDNKRVGSENELWVSLPINGGKFGVPINLFIIGTMNTADRSIALIDIALRRRFEFDRIYPNSEHIELQSWAKNILEKLNESIYNEKKSADFLIGHTFFLNKEEKDKKDIFDKKIIPLLYEYFQNNVGKVESILSAAGIEAEVTNYILTVK